VRAVADARVSCPLEWAEVADVEPAELRLDTVPARLRERGDPAAEIDRHPGSLDSLLELAARDEREGLGDAPWPPHFRKQRGEPRRVQPSRAKVGGEEVGSQESGEAPRADRPPTVRGGRRQPSSEASPPTGAER
jgi:hypothetical protein